MYKNILCFGLIVFSLNACQKDKKPEGVLDQRALTKVMLDVYLAEARLNVGLVPRDSAEKLFKPFEQKMLKSNALTDSTLRITYQYYLAHPKELEQVYDAVIDSLSLREQHAKPAEPAK
jgi:hypothetical protein